LGQGQRDCAEDSRGLGAACYKWNDPKGERTGNERLDQGFAASLSISVKPGVKGKFVRLSTPTE